MSRFTTGRHARSFAVHQPLRFQCRATAILNVHVDSMARQSPRRYEVVPRQDILQRFDGHALCTFPPFY
jgi:hypothetical protein